MSRPDLRLGRLVAVWAPLALTFLLVTGSTPVINAAINRLPGRDHEVDLAAFAVFLSVVIVLHSPLFVTREIAIKLSVDRAGSWRALRFCLGAGVLIAAAELFIGATPFGRRLLGGFADEPGVVAGAHEAFLYVWPVPILVAVRGVYQAHQIRVDDTLFVGLGTAVRIGFTALFGFLLAPRLGWPGAVLGSICLSIGLVIETIFAFGRARLAARPPEISDDATPSPWRFGLPLMVANTLGLVASLFYLRIAGLVPRDLQEVSLAAFQEVKPIHWLFGAGAFALQSLTTAKVRGPGDATAMMRFAAIIGGVLSLLLAACAFTPLRGWILVDLMGEDAGGIVVQLATPALMLASVLPFLTALRFGLRGILISRGRTHPITFVNVCTLLLLSSAIAFDLLPFRENGPLNAYILWTITLLLEIAILGRWASRRRPEPAPLPPPLRSPRESTAG